MATKSPRKVLSDVYSALGKRLGKGLLDEMVHTRTLRPTRTVSKVMAFVIALAVYGVTVGFAVLGIVLVVRFVSNPFAILAGILLLLFAFVARPRIHKFPREFATARDYPRFFALVDKVASALHARPLHAVVFMWEFNAAFGQPGWQRKPVLWLGVPFFMALDPAERIALLAHELSHGVNGDPNRGFFVGTALNSLSWWYVTLHVQDIEVRSISGTISNLFMRAFSGIPWLLWYALAHLLWRDSQRAEYLADYMASEVGGTQAQVGLLRKLRHSEHYYRLAREIALQPDGRDLYGELAYHIAAASSAHVPADDPLDEYELDSTHPPTPYRIEFLQAHPIAAPALEITPEEWHAVEQELTPVRHTTQEQMIERARRALYY